MTNSATPDTHNFIGFEISHRIGKKYNAALRNKLSGRELRVGMSANAVYPEPLLA